MAYPASTIAYAFVKKGINEGRPVTQMKLQKMVYFAQGYYLARFNGDPLIQEDFEAWQFGPVIPDIYQEYKNFGAAFIDKQDEHLDKELATLDEKANEAINYTWGVTRNLSASTLSAWTHAAGSPWANAYSVGSWSSQIDNLFIQKYFKNLFESAKDVVNA